MWQTFTYLFILHSAVVNAETLLTFFFPQRFWCFCAYADLLKQPDRLCIRLASMHCYLGSHAVLRTVWTANWGGTFLHTSWISSKSCRKTPGRGKDLHEREGREGCKTGGGIISFSAFGQATAASPALRCNRIRCWSSSLPGMMRMKAFSEK